MLPPAVAFEQIVSKPRLDSYRGYWKVGRDAAVGLYMWNGEVCGEMSKLLSYLEICLRNGIHREMSFHVSGGVDRSVHWWDGVAGQLKPEARSQIQKVRDKSPHVLLSPDEIVSRMSFGFWPNLLAWIAKQRPKVASKILPAHPTSQPGAKLNWFNAPARQRAVRQFLEFSEIRNRIAHHEPLWKFAAVLDTASNPATQLFPASTDEATTLARFERLMKQYDEAITSLSPLLHASIRTSSWRMRLDFLLSPRGVRRFKDCRHVTHPTALDATAFSDEFAAVVQRDMPVKLRDERGEGIFVPT